MKVRAGKWSFDPADHWAGVSDNAKELVQLLLTREVRDRMTPDAALNHAWVKGTALEGTKSVVSSSMIQNMRSFGRQSCLKKAALEAIAGRLGENDVSPIRQVFETLDVHNHGYLTREDIEIGVREAGLQNVPDLQQIVDEVDTTGNGHIDYTEFLASSLDRQLYTQESSGQVAFSVFDVDGDGKISKKDLNALLSDNMSSQKEGVADAAAGLLKEGHEDGDGEVDYDDFCAMLERHGSGEVDQIV